MIWILAFWWSFDLHFPYSLIPWSVFEKIFDLMILILVIGNANLYPNFWEKILFTISFVERDNGHFNISPGESDGLIDELCFIDFYSVYPYFRNKSYDLNLDNFLIFWSHFRKKIDPMIRLPKNVWSFDRWFAIFLIIWSGVKKKYDLMIWILELILSFNLYSKN